MGCKFLELPLNFSSLLSETKLYHLFLSSQLLYMPPHKVQFHFKAKNLHDRISVSTVTFLATLFWTLNAPKQAWIYQSYNDQSVHFTSCPHDVLSGLLEPFVTSCSTHPLCIFTGSPANTKPHKQHGLKMCSANSLYLTAMFLLTFQKNTNFRLFHRANAIITVYKY